MAGEAQTEASTDPRVIYDECGEQLAQLASQGQGRGDEEFELVLDRRLAASRLLPSHDPNSYAACAARNKPLVYRHAAVSASLVAAARFGYTLEHIALQDAGQQQ